MKLHAAVIVLLLLAAVATVPSYGLYGGTMDPAKGGAKTLLAWSDARSAGGAAAGGRGEAVLRSLNQAPSRDCRTCGTPPR
jgi:hypothetical protein